MFKIFFFIASLIYSITANSLELTVYVNNWLDEIPETYNVHSDDYINLESKVSTVLSDVLNSKSSFNAVRSGPKGQQTSLFTRGTNSNHTLVTINGSSIADHSSSNGLSDLGLIDTNFASQLHMIDGPMSTLYGANAVGGVIDIQSEKKIKNKIVGTIGTYGEKNLYSQNIFGENRQFNLGLSINQSEGISAYPEGQEKDGYDLKGINFSYHGNLENSNYDLLFIRNIQNTDLDASGADDLDYEGKSAFNFIQLNSNKILFKGKLNFILDSYSWDREYVNGSEIDNYYSQSLHLKTALITQNKKINNVIGYDHLLYEADFENRGSYNSSVDKNGQQIGIFNNIDLKLNKYLVLSGGYRIDNNNHFGNQNTYRVGTSYKFKKINFFNSLSTGYKNPTLYEMYGADNFGYTGNPDLKPEVAHNAEIGIKFNTKKINAEFTTYNTKIKEMITYANSTYSNDFDDSSTMQGFNIDLNFSLNKFNFTNSYSHVHAVDSSNTWLKRRPHDLMYSSVIYQKENWSLGTNINYYGEHSDTHSSNFSTIQIKERTIFDLIYKYKFFKLEVNNIFHDTFHRPHGYNQGGRNLKIQYSYTY